VSVGGITVNVSTDGTGNNSGPATKTWVDAKISIAANDTNNITEDHTFTVTVMEDTGSGFVAAAGETVTLSSSGSAGAITGGTCTTTVTDASGQCTVIVSSNVAGSITVSASSAVSVGGITVNVSTDGTGNNSGPATKTWIDGSLVWHKVDDLAQPLAGATFEVCRTHTLDTSTTPDSMVDSADVCFAVTDNVAPDTNPAGGEFLVVDLILGRYTVRETAAPAGYTFDATLVVPAPDMSLADPDVEIVTAFVNRPPNEGCTPGFWQGGNGIELWNNPDDPLSDAVEAALVGYGLGSFDPLTEDFYTGAVFADIFGGTDTRTLLEIVGIGGGPDFEDKAKRDLIAALLNAVDAEINYPYTVAQILDDFFAGDYEAFHARYGTANELGCDRSNGTTALALVIPALGLTGLAIRRGRHQRR
jgi:hypothetical protein